MTKLSLLFLSLCSFAAAQPAADLDKRLADMEKAVKGAQSAGDNAWMLTSAALVLMMTGPGLALFYGGLVRRKNVLGTMMHSFVLMAVITVLWAVAGYSFAFGEGNSFVGGFQYLFLNGVGANPNADYAGTIPQGTFMVYQLMFAIITPALISGAFAERIKFSGMLLFMILWALVVYNPMAHMVWGKNGLLGATWGKIPAFDFAGGTVVHITSGVSALVCALYLGKRKGYGSEPMRPHNIVLSVIGACLLWVGWFGFNAGSALAANGAAGMAMFVTHIGAATGSLAWMFCEWLRFGKPSVLGIVTGMVAGLGTITPASGFVGPLGALVIGAFAGVVCFACTNYMKRALNVDDSLDVFPVHGVGGILGTILTGIFVSATFGGMGLPPKMSVGDQLLVQVTGVISVGLWSAVITLVLLKVTNALTGFKATPEEETEGLDTVLHNERGYNL
jgi:Amt family ammonium transporter